MDVFLRIHLRTKSTLCKITWRSFLVNYLMDVLYFYLHFLIWTKYLKIGLERASGYLAALLPAPMAPLNLPSSGRHVIHVCGMQKTVVPILPSVSETGSEMGTLINLHLFSMYLESAGKVRPFFQIFKKYLLLYIWMGTSSVKINSYVA